MAQHAHGLRPRPATGHEPQYANHSGSRTFIKLTRWVRGTHPSFLGEKVPGLAKLLRPNRLGGEGGKVFVEMRPAEDFDKLTWRVVVQILQLWRWIGRTRRGRCWSKSGSGRGPGTPRSRGFAGPGNTASPGSSVEG